MIEKIIYTKDKGCEILTITEIVRPESTTIYKLQLTSAKESLNNLQSKFITTTIKTFDIDLDEFQRILKEIYIPDQSMMSDFIYDYFIGFFDEAEEKEYNYN